MGKLTTIIFILLTGLATALGFYVASADDVVQQPSLVALKPVVDLLVQYGEAFTLQGPQNLPLFLYGILGVVIATGFRIRKPRWNAFTLGLLLAFVGQWVMINVSLIFDLKFRLLPNAPDDVAGNLAMAIGGGLYLLSILAFFCAFRREDPMSALVERSKQDGAFSLRDAVVLFGIAALALFFRLYAINVIPDKFEGELACFSAGATSFDGLFLANKGVAGAWAPLGILYYLPIYITTKLFGSTLVALRMSSTLVGIFTIPFMFLLGRRIGGKQMGFLAAMLLALDTLHIGWGRTDIHPHGVTTWPSLLLCWLLLQAFDSRKMIDALWVALAMGLTWHQYPSGQGAVAIPIFAVGIYWLCNRFSFPLRWTQLPLLVVGMAIWFVGLPLSYYYPEKEIVLKNPFNLTGPRAVWGGAEGAQSSFDVALLVVQKAYEHFWDVIQGLFYKVPYLFHQDIVPTIPNFNIRSISWVVMPLAVAGFFIIIRSIKRFECAVLLAWMLAAILPGIMSESAYPKRLSSFFPALEMLAALALTRYSLFVQSTRQLWRRGLLGLAVTVTFACYIVWASNAWFAGRGEFKYGEPYEVYAAEEMAKEIKPKTTIIADLVLGYHIGKMTYLLIDPLTNPENRPNL